MVAASSYKYNPLTLHRVIGIRAVPSLCIALLLILFTALSWLAVRTKSPTFDEPAESVAGWVQFWHRDFRLDTDAGALWHDWVGLANGPHALQPDFSDPNWSKSTREHTAGWKWAIGTLYGPGESDPDQFIGHARLMMLTAGVGLGLLIATFAWQLGGPLAALVATSLFCLDPNFIAHAPLIKNDIAFSLAFLALVAVLWSAGKKLSLPTLSSIGLLLGISLTIKFSAILIPPILILLLIIRAFIPRPWRVLGREFNSTLACMTAVICIALISALIAFVFIWSVYTFRFAPTSEASVQLNSAELIDLAHRAEFRRDKSDSDPTPQQLAEMPTPPVMLAAIFIQQHHLLPQSFIHGFLYTYESSLLRNSYLLGEVSIFGHLSYFPLAMLFKTPLATLLVGFVATVLAVIFMADHRPLGFSAIWKMLCLSIPPTIFLLSAIASNLNIGIRHVLVVYPFAYIAAGVLVSRAWTFWPNRRLTISFIGGILLALLMTETLTAFPNYIPFFNAVAGGSTGGIRLLGDSNLDWGQDLPLLAQWQREHPDAPLYLSYFGSVDPAHYGIHYISLPGSSTDKFQKPQWPSKPGYMAISATQLQGIWMPQPLWEEFYRQFQKFKPVVVLGGSIYIYTYPPSQ